MASTMLIDDSNQYDNVEISSIYHAVLKIILLEYINEARFRTPIKQTLAPEPGTSNRHSRNSRSFGDSDVKLPSYLLPNLETRLNLVAMKKMGREYDEMTRRSLLRLYSELLDPAVKAEISRINKPEYLVMKFVSSANKEVVKLGTIPHDEILNMVFKQAEIFVQILISLIQKDKNSDAIIAKLREHKESLKPSVKQVNGPSPVPDNATYLKPTFRVTDMEKPMIELIQQLFSVDQIKLQQDVFKFKDLAQEKTLHKDIQQVSFYLGKDLGKFTAKSFASNEAYQQWKQRENSLCQAILSKYPIPAAMKLIEAPPLPSGEDFYILPPSSLTKVYYVNLIKLCLLNQVDINSQASTDDKPMLGKQATTLLSTCARFWRIDFPTRAVAIYTACHLTDILKDSLYGDMKDVAPINLELSQNMFHICKRIVEDFGKMDWEDKAMWSLSDQEEWTKNLSLSYNETFFGIKESLSMIFNKTVKPKFGPYLMFLGDYLESDSLFEGVKDTGLPKKWEKKLSKALLRFSELRYAELLSNLPRDDTLSIIHIFDISDSIVSDIKMLQKRYKLPLLGFLNVSRTVAAVLTGMFALDSKNILKHIDAYTKNRGEFLPYGDALEAYKSLSEIRFLFKQVSPKDSPFKFDLEKFFFPFLNAWVAESGEKIQGIINQAIEQDTFEPIDIEDDTKKFSSSVLDIFTLIKEYLKILGNLNWENEFQVAKIYTSILKSISDGVLTYSSRISERILKDLDEEEQKRLAQAANPNVESKGSAYWFNEVKNVVSNIQNGSKIEIEEPYNFKPETCIALNNIAAMMQQLSKLEELLDPEMISNTVNRHDPASQRKYTSHIFSLRLIKAENLKSANSSSNPSNMHPYITLIDTLARKTIGKTRTINNTNNPDWDEEFEVTLPANSTLTVSVTVWDERIGTHSICGRSLLQLDPLRFKHDGIPQEIYLDLDSQGRVLVEVAVESEREDAIFVLGRAHRSLKRSQERIIKLIVEKFSRFIHYCFSRSNLRSVCGGNGLLKPTQDQMDDAMMPLYNYLNMNLQVLAEYLTKDLLLKVMLAAWIVVVSSADELLLPRLASAKTFHLSNIGSKLKSNNNNGSAAGWQSAVTSAMANVSHSIGISGFGKSLTNNELETVFSWLNFLCFDFFHNDGNGPPVRDLKNEQYQALLLLPVYYDRDIEFLESEVERLSPAFIKTLRDRNNFDTHEPTDSPKRTRSRAGTLVRNKTILANATAKSRADAVKRAEEARSDPIAAQTLAEDVILRLLLIKDQKSYVARRLEQRERLAHSIATERLARAAAEGKFARR